MDPTVVDLNEVVGAVGTALDADVVEFDADDVTGVLGCQVPIVGRGTETKECFI